MTGINDCLEDSIHPTPIPSISINRWIYSLPSDFSSMASQNSDDGTEANSSSIHVGSSISQSTTITPVDLPIVGKSTKVYQWSYEKESIFNDWWKTTLWYRTEPKEREKIHFNSTHRESSIWRSCTQGAAVSDGRPMIVCTRCDEALIHPQYKHQGNTSMMNHLQTKKCRNVADYRGERQLAITETIPEQVSLRIPSFSLSKD